MQPRWGRLKKSSLRSCPDVSTCFAATAQAAGGTRPVSPALSYFGHRLSIGLPPPHTHTRGHVSVSGDMSAVTGRGCGTGTWQVEARGEHPAEHRTPHNGDTPNTNTASLRTTNSHCFSESS